jgi:prophage regulatory protein
MTRLLRTRDVMQMLGVGRTTLYRWMGDGKFPAPIKIGETNRWHLSEIEAWIPMANKWLTKSPELDGTARNVPER